jgi:hypothetical protein
MYSLEEIKVMNEQYVAATLGEPVSKPFESDAGKPRPLTPYQTAAKFWPGIPEQIPTVEDEHMEGFQVVEYVIANKFGEHNPAHLNIRELREWIRNTVKLCQRPHIGLVGSSEHTVTVALFDKAV